MPDSESGYQLAAVECLIRPASAPATMRREYCYLIVPYRVEYPAFCLIIANGFSKAADSTAKPRVRPRRQRRVRWGRDTEPGILTRQGVSEGPEWVPRSPCPSPFSPGEAGRRYLLPTSVWWSFRVPSHSRRSRPRTRCRDRIERRRESGAQRGTETDNSSGMIRVWRGGRRGSLCGSIKKQATRVRYSKLRRTTRAYAAVPCD